jgi:GGDEF domain-containing protein
MDPITGLPDRGELTETLSEMLKERERPALFAVSIDGFGGLAAQHPIDAEVAVREIGSRLSRLVRANDMLAVLSPGVFALAGPGVETADAEVLLDRIRGVFALPVEVGGDALSFPITVGVAPSHREVGAVEMIEAAESDLARQLGS